jgi:hypothetical protein
VCVSERMLWCDPMYMCVCAFVCVRMCVCMLWCDPYDHLCVCAYVWVHVWVLQMKCLNEGTLQTKGWPRRCKQRDGPGDAPMEDLGGANNQRRT